MLAVVLVVCSLAGGTIFGWLPWMRWMIWMDDRDHPLLDHRWMWSTWLLPFAVAYVATAALVLWVDLQMSA